MAKKILVVDDEKDIVEIYRKALTTAGYEVISAHNGEEGLVVLRANPNVDLIVLDLKMPKMTGDEFLKVIRRDPLFKGTRVLIMSSVLYHYKETHLYDPTNGAFIRTRVEKKGLSKIAKRADDTTKEEEASLELGEKTKAGLEWAPVFGYQPEREADFEQKVSEDLIRRVKEIFGEPYQKAASKHSATTAIEERITDIIAKYFKIDKEKVRPSMSFPDDLKIAFIDAIPLRRRLEKYFKVKIIWENQETIKTVSDLVYCIELLKMYARTKDERFKESNRKFWEDWWPFLYVWALFSLIGLGALIWEFVIKKYFLHMPK